MKLSFFILFLLTSSVICVKKYNGYKVYRIYAKNQQQIDYLVELSENIEGLDIWNGLHFFGSPVDIMVSPKSESLFVRKLSDKKLMFKVFIQDVQALIDNEQTNVKRMKTMTWDSYHDLENIYSWLSDLPNRYATAKTIIGGSSFEQREIKGVKISFGPGKKAVFIEGGIHGREWISPATVTFLIDQLLTSEDSRFRKVANSFDWYLFPVVNPDGYVYSHTDSRLWKKTRKPYQNSCIGVDPNRNWNSHWGEADTSKEPCSDKYGGDFAFSEVETSTLSQYIDSIGSTLVAYLTFHSYGQMLLMPYGYTEEHVENYEEMLQLGDAAVNGLKERYNTSYEVKNFGESLFKTSGSSTDWVKSKYKTPIVFQYEMRDTGKYGYVLPAEEIIPNSLEIIDSIVAMFEKAAQFGYFTLA